jgi:hypothetical protein
VPPKPEIPDGATVASKICVENKAGFVMKYNLKNTSTKEKSESTDKYPIGQGRCMDIKEVLPNVKDGDIIKTTVDAVWGDTNEAEHRTIYRADAGKTTFRCKGTTLNFSCKDTGAKSDDKEQKDIPVIPVPTKPQEERGYTKTTETEFSMDVDIET